ncbi:hypothetical protein RND71_044051 [Anisodus tanguticus]|uniref:Acireductone dioxygenase n=1 Tax=Anisodus tanguticus TaxID=243964 RepID=A0AAE1QNH7_9SOLA|nr:hypothetical protein RND71_044051 [Anisodus tanguticus]
MVQAWYLKNNITEPQKPNKDEKDNFLSLEELKKKTGVEYWKVDADNYENEGLLKKICEDRGYNYMDEITCSPEKLPNYCEKLKIFFEEHLHSDEEIRFVLEGSGYFDCRDVNDKWIRIKVNKNDLITLPPGIYHRFTLDENNYIKAKRLFVGEPVWTAINRPIGDNHPARENYLNLTKKGF